jgi:carotenoid cleavage dioxygenase
MPEKFYDVPGFFFKVKPMRFEADARDLEVIGQIPKELEGTFYRCCPNAQFPTIEHDNITNGDGMVTMLRIENGHADFKSRWVRTERFERERQARKRLFGLYRNPYTDDPSVADATDRDNTANTNAVMHAGRLFALREDSRPTELDPDTLETKGVWDFAGRLRSKAVTAHPKFDPVTGEWWSHGFFADKDLVNNKMCLQVIDKDGVLQREEWFDAPYAGLTHDFAVTRQHVIFPLMPLTVDPQRVQAGGDFYAYDPEKPCYFGIMRRDESVQNIRWFKRQNAFCGHIMNAYTEGDQVVVDCTISHGNGFSFFKDVNGQVTPPHEGVATLSRLTFDLSSPSDSYTVEPFAGAIGEMPRIHPGHYMSKYRYGYMLAIPGGIGRLDWETHTLQVHKLERTACGEPVFVPRGSTSAEGDGFVLSLVDRLDDNRSDLLILDAMNMTGEPLAVVKLPFRAPKAFHGSWVPR